MRKGRLLQTGARCPLFHPALGSPWGPGAPSSGVGVDVLRLLPVLRGCGGNQGIVSMAYI